MQQFVVRRLVLLAPTMFIVSAIIFSLIRLIPGDVADLMVQELAYAPNIEALRERLGLNEPIPAQYLRWAGGLLRGDFGTSLWRGDSTVGELAHRLPVTLELTALSLIVTVLFAIPLGVYSATHPETPLDQLGRSASILFLSVPSFWIATLLIVFPALWWRWTPPLSYTSFFEDPIRNLTHVAIPAIIVGVNGAASLMRMTRAMMLEVLGEDYVRTARAKGLVEQLVVYRHSLKNALLPVLSLLGIRVPFLLGGTVIMERIFGLPGIGSWILESITYRDYPVLQVAVLFFCLMVMVSNLVVDLAYSAVDPRIRYR